jgi:putative flippase GtrA
MKRWLHELSGYAAASAAALLVDIFVLWLLVNLFEMNYVAAASVSFLSGAILAYWLSIKIAFRQHRLRNRRVEFVCFVAIGTGGLAINATVISAVVQILGWHFLAAKGVATGFTFSFNFLARRQMLFSSRPSTEVPT